MKIETKGLTLEVEPELLTDEHIARVKTLLEAALKYERRRTETEIEMSLKADAARRQRKAPKQPK